MSCLTKKSLFFMVLSIICNPTFSDRINECITNVRHIFNEGMLPYFAFNFAMFSLSNIVIESMTTAAELAKHLKDNENAILQYGDTNLNSKHQELIDYFNFLVSQTENRSNTSLESKKQDIFGYFKSLITKVDNARFKKEYPRPIFESPSTREPKVRRVTFRLDAGPSNVSPRPIYEPPRFIFEPTNPVFADLSMSPKKFCKTVYKQQDDKHKCRVSLAFMFHRPEDDLKEMDIKEAFIYCYLNYTHLDFTINNIFPSSDESDKEMLQWALGCMVNYFSHLMDVAFGISLDHLNFIDPFPTVEDYCISTFQTTR